MPGFRAATFNGKFQPRIPATYDGFASFENLTYPPRWPLRPRLGVVLDV